MAYITVRTQAELDEALRKRRPTDWIECVGDGEFVISDSAQVTAYGSAQVWAYDSAQVWAYGSAQVTASDSAQVWAYDSAQVRAYGSAQVRAYGSAQVRASRYQSGIRTVSKGLWLTCPVEGCGQQTYRSRLFTGVDADALADAWAPDPRCFPHLRAARRAEVGA